MSEEVVKEIQNKQDKEQKEFDAAWMETGHNAEHPSSPNKEVPPREDPIPPEPKADEDPDKVTQQGDPVPGVTPDVKAIQDELEREKQRSRSWEGRIRAANERARKAEEEAAKLKESQAKPKAGENPPVPGDDEEDAAVKAFQTEFPDLPKPIIALVKREILPIVRDLVKAELGKIDPVVKDVATLKAHIEVDSETTHKNAITKAHPDWEGIVSSGELDKFIESQPSYVRKALELVVDHGETEEVIDMFGQYKDWKAKTQPQPNNPPPAKPTEDITDELAVPANPGGPRIPKRADKSDFDSGWDEAIKKG